MVESQGAIVGDAQAATLRSNVDPLNEMQPRTPLPGSKELSSTYSGIPRQMSSAQISVGAPRSGRRGSEELAEERHNPSVGFDAFLGDQRSSLSHSFAQRTPASAAGEQFKDPPQNESLSQEKAIEELSEIAASGPTKSKAEESRNEVKSAWLPPPGWPLSEDHALTAIPARESEFPNIPSPGWLIIRTLEGWRKVVSINGVVIAGSRDMLRDLYMRDMLRARVAVVLQPLSRGLAKFFADYLRQKASTEIFIHTWEDSHVLVQKYKNRNRDPLPSFSLSPPQNRSPMCSASALSSAGSAENPGLPPAPYVRIRSSPSLSSAHTFISKSMAADELTSESQKALTVRQANESSYSMKVKWTPPTDWPFGNGHVTGARPAARDNQPTPPPRIVLRTTEGWRELISVNGVPLEGSKEQLKKEFISGAGVSVMMQPLSKSLAKFLAAFVTKEQTPSYLINSWKEMEKQGEDETPATAPRLAPPSLSSSVSASASAAASASASAAAAGCSSKRQRQHSNPSACSSSEFLFVKKMTAVEELITERDKALTICQANENRYSMIVKWTPPTDWPFGNGHVTGARPAARDNQPTPPPRIVLRMTEGWRELISVNGVPLEGSKEQLKKEFISGAGVSVMMQPLSKSLAKFLAAFVTEEQTPSYLINSWKEMEEEGEDEAPATAPRLAPLSLSSSVSASAAASALVSTAAAGCSSKRQRQHSNPSACPSSECLFVKKMTAVEELVTESDKNRTLRQANESRCSMIVKWTPPTDWPFGNGHVTGARPAARDNQPTPPPRIVLRTTEGWRELISVNGVPLEGSKEQLKKEFISGAGVSVMMQPLIKSLATFLATSVAASADPPHYLIHP
uniref:Uncharacterized protein n=1 Tax=Chromera velia CCMP2878 TaxID=1169474 RepID=A0A0G4HY89_9ALVE|eukprot:Cvel_33473.t1-p1 / transcript=Cvel_33473.t1 / gene=Cvel_33473 / organism=Chromera_velia_CCMP2878 / gene_product=hypothetical protein / transcript_product=hypothetical protein / location=Cvel_scaffold5444:83-2647(+) / protein_length=855 / sequence_SO=supercontig / SO=protein_coding / is_pseudo=false